MSVQEAQMRKALPGLPSKHVSSFAGAAKGAK